MENTLLAALKAIPLFMELPEPALLRLSLVAYPRSYAPGELILLEGEPCVAVYFVVSGQARVYRLSLQGRQQVLATLRSGQGLNTVPPFLPDGRNPSSVEAMGATTMMVIPKSDFVSLVRETPNLAWVLLQDFAARLHHLTDLVEDLALRSVRARLARFLLEQADGMHITQQWTQDEIAAQLGTVRDVVGRTLRGLSNAGLLRLDRGRIVLLNREGLEAEVEQ